MKSLFSRIIAKELPAEVVYEDDLVMAIHDIHPVAPVHVLIIPKKEIANLQSLTSEDLPLMGHVVKVAQKIAEELGIEEGYRFLTNNGSSAGQTIFHLHFHLIGGRSLGVMA